MAHLTRAGSVTAGCSRCRGAVSTFEYRDREREFGVVTEDFEEPISGRGFARTRRREFRMFRCAGCGGGGLGAIAMGVNDNYPSQFMTLEWFVPDVIPGVPLPTAAPKEVVFEFREGEACLNARCPRAAAAMFRSALEKTLMAAGYKINRANLYQQIEAAADDATITEARRKRAHDEIRVLGNDVLHDAWKEIDPEDVLLARDYTQRIIEDFYDHRPSTIAHLRAKGRIPFEDIGNS